LKCRAAGLLREGALSLPIAGRLLAMQSRLSRGKSSGPALRQATLKSLQRPNACRAEVNSTPTVRIVAPNDENVKLRVSDGMLISG
jgi:hypothetical protein